MKKKFIDLTGKRFGRLVPVKYIGFNKKGKSIWLCKCNCGQEKIITHHSLINGYTKSCGCLKIEKIKLRMIKHGYSKTKTYRVWNDMVQRCTNPNNISYKNYGARGITICNRWLDKKNGYQNFLKDIGKIPKGLTLDRIDNNQLKEGYSPKNCKLSTTKEQNKNKRNTLKVKINNIERLLIELSDEYNVPYQTLYRRIYRDKWLIEKALTTPVKQRRKKNVRRN